MVSASVRFRARPCRRVRHLELLSSRRDAHVTADLKGQPTVAVAYFSSPPLSLTISVPTTGALIPLPPIQDFALPSKYPMMMKISCTVWIHDLNLQQKPLIGYVTYEVKLELR